MKKFFIIVSSIIISIVICMTIRVSNKKPDNNDVNTITYGLENIPKDLKYTENLQDREVDIICAVSRGLVQKDSDGKIVPDLCSDIIKGNDGIQYKFKIRDDIYWSNGSKISPEDIKTFFLELFKEEKIDNIAPILNIYGAKDYIDGKTRFNNGVAVIVDGDYVVIRLNKADDDFLNELTKPQYRLRRDLVLWEDMYKNYNKIVYSGEYKIGSINDSLLSLIPIDHKDKKIDIVRDLSDELSMAAFEINKRDIVLNPPESEIIKLSNKDKLVTISTDKATYLYINDRKGEVSYNFRKNLYNNIYKAINEYYGDTNKQYDLSECTYFREDKKNLNKIQQRKVLLNSSLDWDKPKLLTIIAYDTVENRNLCRNIVDWFKVNQDITVRCNFTKEDFNSDIELRDRYDMVLINSEADTNMKRDLFNNFFSYLSSEEIKLLKGDSSDLNILEDTLFNNFDIVPLVFYNENIGISDKISSLNCDGNGNIEFNTLK